MVEIIHGGGTHEGQLHVGVRINAARHDELTTRVNGLCAGRSQDAFRNFDDLAVYTQNIGFELTVCIDHRAATN